MITLRLPPLAAEHVSFEVSALSEAVHSWHVLAVPGHHALQIPWVRRCRDLTPELRGAMRHAAWVVRDYVPALFEAGSGLLDRGYSDEREIVRRLPVEQVAADLAEAARYNHAEPEWVRRIEADPGAVLAELLDILDAYWDEVFAEEWARVEPQLLDAVAEAGQRLPSGVLEMLGRLTPAIRLDARRRTVVLDRSHEHHVEVADRGPLRLSPSFYTWPHVRVTCEEPWPLRIAYPVVPPSPYARRSEPAALLAGLRALGASQRLEIVRLLKDEARSTQELGGLLGLSGPAVSRHLKLLLDAQLVGVRREGYYVLYELLPGRLDDLAYDLQHLGTNTEGSYATP